MSVFGSIMSKIFSAGESLVQSVTGGPSAAAESSPAKTSTPEPSQAQPAATSPSSNPAAVDVEAVLTQMASAKGGGGNWQTSIVDLLKLLDLDSSLNARKELGNELAVHAADDGSAEQNTALHRAVMQKLAENGGKVPDSLKG